MTIDIKDLQTIIKSNRIQLAALYAHKALYKSAKRRADEQGNTPAEYICHNRIKELSKEIAKLAALQKNLKAEVREIVARKRIRTTADKINALLDAGGF